MTPTFTFPTIGARSLQGIEVELPTAFVGERNIVIIVFRRDHQRSVDSWVPWFEARSEHDPGLRFYEIPTLARLWAPVRNFIDGGMASAIRDPVVLQRTLTVYGDVNRLAKPLGIVDRSTIAVFLVDASGHVRWRGAGALTTPLAQQLERALMDDSPDNAPSP